MINLLCKSDLEIGTMGQLMIIIEVIESKIKLLENIKSINIINSGKKINANPFDYIFMQNNLVDHYTTIDVSPFKGAYEKNIPNDKLIRFKTIMSKFILKDEIINKFNSIKKDLLINDTFLGAHIRLTDMNACHGDIYGCVYINDFMKTIDDAMKTNEYTKIFVASDSQESISKLKKNYGDTMVCYDDFIRLESEEGNLVEFINKNLPTNKKWIQDSFIEMLLLSECGALIHRVSNFANIVKVKSNTIKKLYFIDGKKILSGSTGRIVGDWIIYVENGIVNAKRR